MRRLLTILLGLTALTVAGNGHAQNGVVSIDDVTHCSYPYELRAGNVHQVSIRYNFLGLSSTGFWNGVNGFEVYAPDGADWGFLQGSTGPLLETAANRGNLSVFQKHFNFDAPIWSVTGNNGADPAGGSTGSSSRAGFYQASISIFGDAGYLGGTDNGIALTLEFASSLADTGRVICVDTCDQFTTWEWAGSGGNQDYPQWDNGLGVDGPRCWVLTYNHNHCCEGLVGNANGLGGDEPTVGDIAVMVDAKWISGTCTGLIDCLAEADVNQSGGYDPTCDDVTIADVTILIDYLFINGPGLVDLSPCLY